MRNAFTGLFFALLLSGCASNTVYEVAVGANVTDRMPWSAGRTGGFDGPRDTFRFTARHEMGRTFVAYSHISHLSAGWPVNDRSEDWLDHVEFGVRFGGGQ